MKKKIMQNNIKIIQKCHLKGHLRFQSRIKNDTNRKDWKYFDAELLYMYFLWEQFWFICVILSVPGKFNCGYLSRHLFI